MEKDFIHKVAVVTGGSSGIGQATALAFAKLGAKVVIADWKEDPEQKTLHEVKALGGEALFIPCDVSQDNQVKAMTEKVVAEYGRIDFAFNNAGIEGAMVPLHEYPEEVWDKIMGVNLKGVWLCMKYQIPQMREQGSGAIVNTSSVAGLIGMSGLSAYVATKHAVVGLTKSAALENAQSGIRVNAVCPGVIKTPMVERVTQNDPEGEKQFIAMEPVGRMGMPSEIAEAVVWLCSDAASFITGDAMAVDGGWTAG